MQHPATSLYISITDSIHGPNGATKTTTIGPQYPVHSDGFKITQITDDLTGFLSGESGHLKSNRRDPSKHREIEQKKKAQMCAQKAKHLPLLGAPS